MFDRSPNIFAGCNAKPVLTSPDPTYARQKASRSRASGDGRAHPLGHASYFRIKAT